MLDGSERLKTGPGSLVTGGWCSGWLTAARVGYRTGPSGLLWADEAPCEDAENPADLLGELLMLEVLELSVLKEVLCGCRDESSGMIMPTMRESGDDDESRDPLHST